jgi:hypothetical protein
MTWVGNAERVASERLAEAGQPFNWSVPAFVIAGRRPSNGQSEAHHWVASSGTGSDPVDDEAAVEAGGDAGGATPFRDAAPGRACGLADGAAVLVAGAGLQSRGPRHAGAPARGPGVREASECHEPPPLGAVGAGAVGLSGKRQRCVSGPVGDHLGSPG